MSEENVITVNLPATISAHGSDTKVEIIPANWEDADGFAEYLIQYAAGVILQRSSAGKSDEPEKAEEAVQKAVDRLQKGIVPAGGGFTKLSAEDYAMKEALTASKVKFEKGESISDCLSRIAGKIAGEDAEEAVVEQTKAELVTELEATEVFKSALKARKAKAKTAKNGGLLGKL